MSVFAQRNGTSATGASLILGGTFSLEQAAIINLELEIRSQVQLTGKLLVSFPFPLHEYIEFSFRVVIEFLLLSRESFSWLACIPS